MEIRGYLPEQIIFYIRDKNCQKNGHPCKEAFPVSSESPETTHNNAKSWANRTNCGAPKQPHTKQEVPNAPTGGFRLVGAEQRAEGGRAWKVITPEGYLVDLREDVFLPILLKKGLPKTGLINARFQWAQVGSQLKLVEVGSTLHKQMVTSAERKVRQTQARKVSAEKAKARKRERLPAKDLEIGGVYEYTSYGCTSRLVYLGRVTHNGKKKYAWTTLPDRGVWHLEQLLNRTVHRLKPTDYQSHFDLNREADHGLHRLEMSAAMVAEKKLGKITLPDGIREVTCGWRRTDGVMIHGVVRWVKD